MKLVLSEQECGALMRQESTAGSTKRCYSGCMKIGEKEKEIILRALRSVSGAERLSILIFGSQARGDASFGSDIDVGVKRLDGSPLPPGALADMQEALDESSLTGRAEVVDLARTSQKFRTRALEHTISL